MKVFLCWSGERSKAVAETLRAWLPKVIQAVEPWISTKAEKGIRWQQEIGHQLEQARVGIVCLTSDNLGAPWIHFESGALAKTKDARVCTFLLGVKPATVKQPLAQFQHTEAKREDVRLLLQTINGQVRVAGERWLDDATLNSVFAKSWPELESRLKGIPAASQNLIPRLGTIPFLTPTTSTGPTRERIPTPTPPIGMILPRPRIPPSST